MDVIARAGSSGVCNEKPSFHVGTDEKHPHVVVLSCSVNKKNAFEGNHVSFKIPGKRDIDGKGTIIDVKWLEIEIIHDSYCKPEQPACDCGQMLNKVFNYAPNKRAIAIDVEYLPLEMCECVLQAAFRNFQFTSAKRSEETSLHKPECQEQQKFVNELGAREVCDFYRANKCGNGRVYLTL